MVCQRYSTNRNHRLASSMRLVDSGKRPLGHTTVNYQCSVLCSDQSFREVDVKGVIHVVWTKGRFAGPPAHGRQGVDQPDNCQLRHAVAHPTTCLPGTAIGSRRAWQISRRKAGLPMRLQAGCFAGHRTAVPVPQDGQTRPIPAGTLSSHRWTRGASCGPGGISTQGQGRKPWYLLTNRTHRYGVMMHLGERSKLLSRLVPAGALSGTGWNCATEFTEQQTGTGHVKAQSHSWFWPKPGSSCCTNLRSSSSSSYSFLLSLLNNSNKVSYCCIELACEAPSAPP